jgi:ribonuclease P protein component
MAASHSHLRRSASGNCQQAALSMSRASDISASHETQRAMDAADCRLRKHADYQRVYKASRKQFSTSMTYFHAAQPATLEHPGPRIGLTVGKVLGGAVVRNRIKRRMREAVRQNLKILTARVDVILHPRRSVLEANFEDLKLEVGRVFTTIETKAPGVRQS